MILSLLAQATQPTMTTTGAGPFSNLESLTQFIIALTALIAGIAALFRSGSAQTTANGASLVATAARAVGETLGASVTRQSNRLDTQAQLITSVALQTPPAHPSVAIPHTAAPQEQLSALTFSPAAATSETTVPVHQTPPNTQETQP